MSVHVTGGRANYRMKICGEVPRAANFRSKIRGAETIGVVKMRRNFAEISFRANFRQKARQFVEIHLHYFCTILYSRMKSQIKFQPVFAAD